jgi:hypothetical protein
MFKILKKTYILAGDEPGIRPLNEILLLSDMAFSLPFSPKGVKLFVGCVNDPATKRLDWMYQLANQSWSPQMPACDYLCAKDPLDDPGIDFTKLHFGKKVYMQIFILV